MSREEQLELLTKLLDFYKKNIQGSNNHHSIQLSLVWLKNVKNKDIQILLLNHSEKVLTEKINIYGPYYVSKRTTFLEIESDLKKTEVFEYFDAKVDEIKYNLKKLALKNLSYFKKESKKIFIKDGVFCSGCSYWIFHGNMFSTSYNAIKTYFIEKKEYKKRIDDFFEVMTKGGDLVEVTEEESPLENIPEDFFLRGDIERDYEMPFLVGFILPPIWFGDAYLFSHDYKNPEELPLSSHIKTVCHMEISGHRIIVKSDGFLGVSINKNFDGNVEYGEERETNRFINFFLGIFHLINDTTVYSSLESEFFHTYYYPKKDCFDSDLSDGFKGYSIRTHDMFKERQKPAKVHFSIKRRIVPPDNLKLVLEDLQLIIIDEQLFNSLNLLIDAHTHLEHMKLIESFILSWVIIEQFLNYSWNKLLTSKKISNKRKKQLNSKEYTASVKINILNLLGILNNDEFKQINELRKTRNEFMHEIKLISPQDAISAYKLAKNYLKRRSLMPLFENQS